MHRENDHLFDGKNSFNIIQDGINLGEVGFASWNISKETLIVFENITGQVESSYQFNSMENIKEFLKRTIYFKDKAIAITDMKNYLIGKTISYHSSFRITTTNGSTKWILVKGKILYSDNNEKIMNLIIHDVTGINYQVSHDSSTNLLNRDFLIKKLSTSIKLHEMAKEKGAIILLNIVNFQSLMNVYGFDISRKVTEKIAEKLAPLIRNKNELAKLPNENFVLMIQRITNFKELEELFNEIYEIFEHPFIVNDIPLKIDINMGIVVFPDYSNNPVELLMYAEYAAQQSRIIKTNNHLFFDEDLAFAYRRELQLKNELADSVRNKELYLNFQPQLDLTNQRINGVEALVRWNNKLIGEVSPAEFIPIAEQEGYMNEIGAWILEEGIKTIKQWMEKGFDFGPLSINISPIELLRSDFALDVARLCKKYKVPHHFLELEITERVYVEEFIDSTAVINNLRQMGFRVAIDDFGTGYSNLKFLLKANIDTLKIDKSIIDDISDTANQLILSQIISLKNHLNYGRVIAEGVETKEQLDILKQLAFDGIQGYYYSKPVSLEKIEHLIIEKSKQ